MQSSLVTAERSACPPAVAEGLSEGASACSPTAAKPSGEKATACSPAAAERSAERAENAVAFSRARPRGRSARPSSRRRACLARVGRARRRERRRARPWGRSARPSSCRHARLTCTGEGPRGARIACWPAAADGLVVWGARWRGGAWRVNTRRPATAVAARLGGPSQQPRHRGGALHNFTEPAAAAASAACQRWRWPRAWTGCGAPTSPRRESPAAAATTRRTGGGAWRCGRRMRRGRWRSLRPRATGAKGGERQGRRRQAGHGGVVLLLVLRRRPREKQHLERDGFCI